MNNNRIVTIIAFVSCLAGCSIDEPPRFNGSSCGGADIPFLGILGDKSLSDKRHPTADQNGRYNMYHICPEEFPYCVYVQNGAVMDESAGVMCSSCKQGQLLCDANSGSKECTEVLHNREHCGGCGIHCDGLCINGRCLNPDSDETCGATEDNPDGESCGESRECVKGKCQCKTGLTECNGNCVDLNSNESCGTSCSDMMRCNIDGGQSCDRGKCVCALNQTYCANEEQCLDLYANDTCGLSCNSIKQCLSDEGQYCDRGECRCPLGLLLREGHCVDPKRNNKYCGANDSNNKDGMICDISQDIVCVDGVCSCLNGLIRTKEGGCVDPRVDANYCGAVLDQYGYAIEDEYKCAPNESCSDGKCICGLGYHVNANNSCIKNSNNSCGARGRAYDDLPASANYKGFVCPNGTTCDIVSIPAKRCNHACNGCDVKCNILGYTLKDIETCRITNEILLANPDLDKYRLYDSTGEQVIGYADSKRVKSCEKKNVLFGKVANSCVCQDGYGGELCEIDWNECEQNGFHCYNGKICEAGECQCPVGEIREMVDGKEVCVSFDSSHENCGTSFTASRTCRDDEICEKSECVSCASSQTVCMNTCMENYDLGDPITPSLVSLSDKHIQSCTFNSLVCEEGYAQCNSSIWDGCESLESKDNCGACGNICGETASCINGTCCLDAAYPSVELTSGEYQNAKCCDENKNRKCQSQDASGRMIYRCRTACVDDEVDVTEDT